MKNNKYSIRQAKDTGLAFVLISLLVAYFADQKGFMLLAVFLIVICMIWPSVFRPISRFWFGLSNLLGTIVSRILLTIIYIMFVTPVGLIRRLLGADPMRKNLWKKGTESVFQENSRIYSPTDLEKPF